MEQTQPHIALLFVEDIPAIVFEDFVEAVSAPGLDLTIESREPPGPFAGVEWLIPTGVILFITQGYFNGFLGEMGKDHYDALKKAFKALRQRFSSVKVTLVGSPGKASEEQPYSLVYSIYFDADERRTFKFLVPNDDDADATADAVMDVFGDFLEAYYAEELSPDHATLLADAPAFGGTVLIAFNPKSGRIEPIHPITRSFGSPQDARVDTGTVNIDDA